MGRVQLLLVLLCFGAAQAYVRSIPARRCSLSRPDNDLRIGKDARHRTTYTSYSSLSYGSADNDIGDDEIVEGFPISVAKPLLLLLFSQLILFVGVGAVIPAIPLYGRELGLSSSESGIVISAPAVALLLLANFSGSFADQKRKNSMMIGMALIAVSDVGTAVAENLPSLVVARLGLGAGRSISESGERGMLADFANQVPRFRGKVLGAQQAVLAVGIAIGAPLGGQVIDEYGARANFLCVSAAAVAALLLYSFLPETRDAVSSPLSSNGGNIEEERNTQGDWKVLLRDKRWKGLALCQCGLSFGFAAKIAAIPLLATEVFGDAKSAGLLLSAAGLSGIVGAPIGGFLTDRTGAKTTAILAGAVSAFAFGFVPLALTANLGDPTTAFSLLVVLWGIATAAQVPALTAIAQELAPDGAEAKSLALPRAAGDGTYIASPFLLGLVADQNLGQGVECAAAGAAILSGVLALAILDEQ